MTYRYDLPNGEEFTLTAEGWQTRRAPALADMGAATVTLARSMHLRTVPWWRWLWW